MPLRQSTGFTLIELSIVLVIIGLLVGGILVGQDLIRGAQVRSLIKQVQSVNTAANVFRDKYRYLPGDILPGAATNFGFGPLAGGISTRTGALGNSDGNGLVQSGATNKDYVGYETGLFWRDLSTARMIEGKFATATASFPSVALTSVTVQDWLPASALNSNDRVMIYEEGGFNYFQVIGVTGVATTGEPTTVVGMSPADAYRLDQKLDDGLPLSGVIVALAANNAVATANPVPVAGDCVGDPADGSPYNTKTQLFASTYACGLRFRFN